MENDLKGIENYLALTGGSSYRGFELPGVDCIFDELRGVSSGDGTLCRMLDITSQTK